LRDATDPMAYAYALHSQSQGIAVTLCGVIILVVGGMSVANHSMTMGQFLSFWVAAGLLNGHLSMIASGIPEWIAGNASMSTLHRFALTHGPLPYHGREGLRFEGGIELENVTFGYRGTPVIKNVSLELQPGETAAVIGPN